ncbi:MAG: hypothetical protein AAGB35_06235, partial [Pseudomonadota bacterium]
MKKIIKRIIKFLRSHGLIQALLSYSHLPIGSTVLIHIGKCGGKSVKNGTKNAEKNFVNHKVHLKKPVYRKDLKYIIIARGPIDRLNSAFKWRYKLVVTDGTQKDKYKGEYEILKKYKTLNNIAEALYDNYGIA